MAGKKSDATGGPRAVGELDIYIGARVRARRRELNMSQEALADALGITFQQVQKYEKGVNRVASPVLYKITKVLDAPLTSFFPAARADAKFGEGPVFEAPNDEALAALIARLNPRGRALLGSFVKTLLTYEALTKRR